MQLKLTAADKTDVGKQREQNEDCAYKRIESLDGGDRGLFIVADGMGGYQAGEVASKLAVDTISRAMDSFFKPLTDKTITFPKAAVEAQEVKANKTVKLPETPVAQSVEDQFTAAIQLANKAILRYGEQKSSARGLGSTVTAALIHDSQAYVANVGDSRTYLLRNGQLTPITKDHSLVARLVEAKQIEPEDIYTHPQRNLIYRSLGAGHKTIEVDIFHQTLKPGDTLLLCSDGLWEMVRSEDLLKELSEKTSPQKICDTLIDLANANGGEDNITAVVVHISAL